MERDRDLLRAASALSARSSAASRSKAAFLYLAPSQAAASSFSFSRSSCLRFQHLIRQPWLDHQEQTS